MLWKLERQSLGLPSACTGHKEHEGPSLISLPPREGACSASPAEIGGLDLRAGPWQRVLHSLCPQAHSRSRTHLFVVDSGPGGISHHKALGWGLGLFM